MSRFGLVYAVGLIGVLIVTITALLTRPLPTCPDVPLQLGPDLVGPRGLYTLSTPREPPAIVLRALEDNIAREGFDAPVEYLGTSTRDRLQTYLFRGIVKAKQGPYAKYITLLYDPAKGQIVTGN